MSLLRRQACVAEPRRQPKLTLQIIKRRDDLHTFQVLPRRWVVERTLAWITRHRSHRCLSAGRRT